MEENLNKNGQNDDLKNTESLTPTKADNSTETNPEGQTETVQKPKPSFKDTWAQEDFDGKALFNLNNNGDLTLKDSEKGKDRIIAHLNSDNYSHTIEKLKKKFTDTANHFEEITKEWETQEDKIQLFSQVHHFRQHLNDLDALGNFEAIWSPLKKIEATLKEILDKNYKIKEALVLRAEEIKLKDETRREDWDNLVEEWKQSPFIEKDAGDRLWSRIENARAEFRVHQQVLISERNKEQMQNLDFKMEICEKAEALSLSEDWHQATDALKDLFEQWKKIGMVPSQEKNNELWTRFQLAQKTFYDRKSEHYEKIKAEQEKNYEEKLKLVEEAESIQNQTNWKETTQHFETLMEKWRNIGWVPHEKSDEIWKRLQKAKDIFFSARRQSAEEFKSELNVNLQKKLDLVEKANQFKDSTDWRTATEELNKLMEEWKTIGRVPREKSEEVWNHFLSARKHFFAQKDAHRKERRDQFLNRINSRIDQTRHFLNELKDENFEDIAKLKDFKDSLEATNGTTQKDSELRQHLSDLIRDLERKIPNRTEKIQKVEDQLKDLLEKKEDNGNNRQGRDRKQNDRTEPLEENDQQQD